MSIAWMRFLPTNAAAASEPPAAIAWLHDEAQATEQARRSGKPLLIDFRADWCGACKMLDADTWADPAVRAAKEMLSVLHAADERRRVAE